MNTRFARVLSICLQLAVACLAAAAPSAALAQYPNKPVRLIVPFPPGGSADAIARSISQAMGTGLGQPVIVESKAGADGMIAADAVKTAPPDGYTLFFATNTAMNAAPVMHKSITYDPLADFTPIGRIGYFGFFVFVNDSLPVKTLAQLFDHARANPGKLAYGSATARASSPLRCFAVGQGGLHSRALQGRRADDARPAGGPRAVRDRDRYAAAAREGRQAAHARHAAAQWLLPVSGRADAARSRRPRDADDSMGRLVRSGEVAAAHRGAALARVDPGAGCAGSEGHAGRNSPSSFKAPARRSWARC